MPVHKFNSQVITQHKSYFTSLGSPVAASAKHPDSENPQQTALVCAADGGSVATAILLLDRGADINQKDTDGETALFNAASAGHVEMVTLLLESGLDVGQKNSNGRTALFIAASMGHVATVTLLLDRGADINQKDTDGETVLMCAANGGHAKTVRLLLDRGAEINQKDTDGETALMSAADNGHLETVTLLLDRGADINQKDNKESDAIEHLTRRPNRNCKLLREQVNLLRRKKHAQDALTFPLYAEFIRCWNIAQQSKYEELVQARRRALMEKKITDAMSLKTQLAALNYNPMGRTVQNMRAGLQRIAIAIDARYSELVDADNDDVGCDICVKYRGMIDIILARNPPSHSS